MTRDEMHDAEIVRLRAALASMVAHVRNAQRLGWREIDLAYINEAADRADALLSSGKDSP